MKKMDRKYVLGIPDGVVDTNDLSAFCGDWLKDANDPNTW